MTSFYLDSSAATKLYVVERGSKWVTELVRSDRPDEFFVVQLSIVEIVAALYRRARNGDLSRDEASHATRALQKDFMQTFRVVDVTQELLDRAIAVAEQYALRGYDCVQLAAALIVRDLRRSANRPDLTFASADKELNAAAVAAGFSVVDPNDFE